MLLRQIQTFFQAVSAEWAPAPLRASSVSHLVKARLRDLRALIPPCLSLAPPPTRTNLSLTSWDREQATRWSTSNVFRDYFSETKGAWSEPR